MLSRKKFLKLLLLPVLASPLCALAHPAYKVRFAPAGFAGYHINNVGDVVGMSDGIAAIWSGATVTTIPAILAPSRGFAMNNRGHIVGIGVNGLAFVYTVADGVRDLNFAVPYNEFSWAYAINDSGQIVGFANPPVGEAAKGFMYYRGVSKLIGTFGGDSSVIQGINNKGVAVGLAALPDHTMGTPHEHAFVYRNGVLKSLGTLGGRNSVAREINDAGQIVGDADTRLVTGTESSPRHVFLYERGTMKNLGSLGGTVAQGYAINSTGVLVGESLLKGDATSVAFVYVNGKMLNLNTRVRLPSGWRLVSALDINDAGQILARACHLDDCNHYARLTLKEAAAKTAADDEAADAMASRESDELAEDELE